MLRSIIVLLAITALASASLEIIPSFARIESCPGCSLNRLPEVKSFIYDDVPKYENVEFKRIHGAPPELVLLNGSDEEMDRLPLAELTRQECNDLLKKHGFKKSPEIKKEF